MYILRLFFSLMVSCQYFMLKWQYEGRHFLETAETSHGLIASISRLGSTERKQGTVWEGKALCALASSMSKNPNPPPVKTLCWYSFHKGWAHRFRLLFMVHISALVYIVEGQWDAFRNHKVGGKFVSSLLEVCLSGYSSQVLCLSADIAKGPCICYRMYFSIQSFSKLLYISTNKQVYLSIHPSVRLSVCLSVCLSIQISYMYILSKCIHIPQSLKMMNLI